ncbi:2276_t:CDS:10 [Ambispora gerdemannii]|uniref:2276_t:CDS:1 n=1 Tax=Ambispora gerdemannii TaxID=144530 RepID=A0A9N9BJW8_9GLOM|nr:2276_t:CDS:10 [Ambispora gerdemannii]
MTNQEIILTEEEIKELIEANEEVKRLQPLTTSLEKERNELLEKIKELEERVEELYDEGDEQVCNFCLLDFDDPTLLNFDTALATHQMVARNTPDGYSDIVFICGESKSTKSLSDKELLSQAFSFRLENKTRELEKELSITNEELKVEREEELLDKIKQQETEIIKLTQKIEQLKTLIPQELVNKLNAYEAENEKLKNQLEQLQQNEDKKSGKDCVSSISLNHIIDSSNNEVFKQVNDTLNESQIEWLNMVLRKKSWKQTDEFQQYISQFTEDMCDRVNIPILVRESFVSKGSFNSYRHKAHDIVQQILTHFSVRLEAPMRIESNSLDLERTYAIDITVYILNRLFRMHQDVVDNGWIELTTPDTKNHKIDELFKVIKTTQKNQAIIIVEFSFGRRAPLTKEDNDQVKLCRNSMRILNKLLQSVPKDKARVYLIQAVNGYIIIKYLVRPLPLIYILHQFARIRIPVSFDDFEQFAKDMAYLMTINKEPTGDNNIHITSVQNTPAKKRNDKNQPLPSSPKSPSPGSPLQRSDLFSYLE